MRRLAAVLLIAAALAGCSKLSNITMVSVFEERDYQWHKVTSRIKVHWNVVKNADGTVSADGYVEPLNPKYGLFDVELEFAGLDRDGNIVSSAKGRPADSTIMTPQPKSYFRVTLTPSGDEKKYTVHGSLYHFMVGTNQLRTREFYSIIPLNADEPY